MVLWTTWWWPAFRAETCSCYISHSVAYGIVILSDKFVVFWLHVYVNTHVILYIVFWLNTTEMTHLKTHIFISFHYHSENSNNVPIYIFVRCINFNIWNVHEANIAFEIVSLTDTGILNTYPLQTKRRPLCLKTQSVPRCKHFSSRL